MTTRPFPQSAILDEVPAAGRFLVFDVRVGVDPRPALRRWRDSIASMRTVTGIGQPLALAAGAKVPGLYTFPGICGRGVTFPSTQGSLFAFFAGSDQSELHDRATAARGVLGDDFVLREEVASFQYRGGRDLTGYEDGTENPKGENALAAAIVSGQGPGLDGASFVAVQKYVHDLEAFGRQTPGARDNTIGRRQTTNEEMPDAPPSAHVKRTAQESYDPPAFMVRRSMPWGGVSERGLVFVAYGESLDRFERQLRRMAGLDDGIVDGLLSYTKAVSGGYYWCPPLDGDRLDLRAIGM